MQVIQMANDDGANRGMFRPDPGEGEGKVTWKTLVDYAFHRFREQMVEQHGEKAVAVLGGEDAYKAFVAVANGVRAVADKHKSGAPEDAVRQTPLAEKLQADIEELRAELAQLRVDAGLA